MKTRIILPLSVALTFLLAALATGSPLLLMPVTLILLTLLAGWLSVRLAAATMTVSAKLDHPTVRRGEDVCLSILVRHRGLLPIAPILLEIVSAPGAAPLQIRLRDVPGKQQSLSMPFHASHVGASSPGIRTCTVEDLLGFFSLRKPVADTPGEMMVLPRFFSIQPLVMAPGEPGSDLMSRATEDLSAPSEIREYQAGDPMKKIHWKLSLRKRELLVRKYEEPVLQDVLILMDCSRPPSWGHPEAEADIRDTLLETAASVFHDQEGSDLSLHMPLFGSHPVELEKGMGLPLVMENLARTDFSEPDRFERVLMMESRRLRKVGCLIIISARLNSDMVDVMIRMRHIGPNLRLYLITFAPDDPRVLSLISRLQQTGIEVSYVTPEKV